MINIIKSNRMDKEGNRIVVCDNGTGYVKCGEAGCNFPQHIFPSLVGRPMLRYARRVGNAEIKDLMVGEEAASVRQMLEISYPMEKGIVKNWEDMKHIWDYTFSEKKMNIDFDRSKILLTEAPLNPVQNRRKLLEVMMEEYGFNACTVAIQAVMTLYSQGVTSGVVIDSGDGVTHICPVYEGFALEHLTKRLDIAGRNITQYLIKLLFSRGYAFNSSADAETVKKIKEDTCYVAYDIAKETKLALETTTLVKKYNLPDGRHIRIAAERFQAPECLFQPNLIDVESKGMAELLFDTIQSADIDVRSSLYNKIYLSGGSTMYPGLPSRLERELKQLYLTKVLNNDESRLKNFKLRVEDPPNRKHMVFWGGAVFANLIKDIDSFWINKQDYFELGVDKCLEKLQQRRILG
ncbi:hypothetical protein SNEBB_000155 [Seison nebaliae]|nr:hypothetical protein SNEBB_000155 [Seison nebaliae]